MKGSERALVSAAVVVLLAGSSFDLYEFNMQGTSSIRSNSSISTFLTTGFVTWTRVSSSDTFLNSTICPPPVGGGGLELRVVSDSTGVPVSGETINAVDAARCIPSGGRAAETQVVYIDEFSAGKGGWPTPIISSDAEGTANNFTVSYQEATYSFVVNNVPPIGIVCVTLHVPSGNVTNTTTMNGCES
jgi:hypothetical protein